MKKTRIVLMALLLVLVTVPGLCEQDMEKGKDAALSLDRIEECERESKLAMLIQLGYLDEEALGDEIGQARVVSAVKAFQKDHQLKTTGEIRDSKTHQAMLEDLREQGYIVVSSEGEEAKAAIRDIQTGLQKLGYYFGDVTGHMGVLTQDAVMRYQHDHDLLPTGAVDSTLLEAIRAGETNP